MKQNAVGAAGAAVFPVVSGLLPEPALADAAVGGALRLAFQSWDRLLEWLPIGVYTCDRDGRLGQYNRRAAELWGRAPLAGDPTVKFCGAQRVFAADGTALEPVRTPTAEALRTAAPVRDRELTIERPDGSRIVVLANVDPIFDATGALAGAVNCFQDITERRRAEQLVAERERWYREILEALPAAVYTTDTAGNITYYNQAAVDLSGRRPEIGTDRWCVTWKLFEPDGTPLPHAECPMAVALREGRPVRGIEAVAERPDGSRVPFMPYPTPIGDAQGALAGAVNMLVDISERKRAEERQRRLVDELNHRVKNTLATVQSLAAQTLRQRDVPDEVAADFDRRLFALSLAHDHLSHTQWEGGELGAVIRDVIVAPFNGQGARIDVRGESITLGPQAALTLAMILHELATNAVKYGALSGPAGKVEIRWTLSGQGSGRRVALEWQESGGPEVRTPTRRGFGSRLLNRAVTQELRGHVAVCFAPTGFQCSLDFPLS